MPNGFILPIHGLVFTFDGPAHRLGFEVVGGAFKRIRTPLDQRLISRAVIVDGLTADSVRFRTVDYGAGLFQCCKERGFGFSWAGRMKGSFSENGGRPCQNPHTPAHPNARTRNL